MYSSKGDQLWERLHPQHLDKHTREDEKATRAEHRYLSGLTGSDLYDQTHSRLEDRS